MSLVLATTAIKITNKGGGTMRRWVRDEVERNVAHAMEKSDSGTDYVTFMCPHPSCQRRQKQSMYDALAYHLPEADRIPFKCKFCLNTIEVARPTAKGGSLLVSPAEFNNEMAQRRRGLAGNR